MNISRQTAHKWWGRYCEEGEAGLVDRSGRPYSCPHQTPSRVERRIVALRRSRKLEAQPASLASSGSRRRRCIGCWCATA